MYLADDKMFKDFQALHHRGFQCWINVGPQSMTQHQTNIKLFRDNGNSEGKALTR